MEREAGATGVAAGLDGNLVDPDRHAAAVGHVDEQRIVGDEDQVLPLRVDRPQRILDLDALDHRLDRRRRVEAHAVQVDLGLHRPQVEEAERAWWRVGASCSGRAVPRQRRT